jgi:wyosine [tRNA(Phe)-imidazoG37] synthetase (radical SAM superfamily)
MEVFGPVPSRRLGKSLGINNIPPKICTYSCIYCQLGKKSGIISDRRSFYDPEQLYRQVDKKLKDVKRMGEQVDYISFVPDGEPTLDKQLGRTIRKLKSTGIKVAVITNASLIGDIEVRDDLCLADWISLKIDAVDRHIWKKQNRPHKMISFTGMLEGIRLFSQAFDGTLVTETMLVKHSNDNPDHVRRVGEWIAGIHPGTAYLSIPTRPPHLKTVKQPDRETIIQAYQVFKENNLNVELLTGYEGNAFVSTGNPAEDVLDITSVHPMRKEALEKLLHDTSASWSIIDNLVNEKKLIPVDYKNHRYYLRNTTR